MNDDPWAYQRKIDQSRLLQAEATLRLVVPEGRVQRGDNGEFVLTLKSPLVDLFGVRKWLTSRRVIGRCITQVPILCGWCPKLRIKWER